MRSLPTRIRRRFQTACELSSVPMLSLSGRASVMTGVLLNVGRHRSKRARITLKKGRVSLDASHHPDWSVFREVFLEQAYATDYRDSVVIDIGAHRGAFAAFALANGAGALLAFEPVPANFAFLQDTLASFAKYGCATSASRCAVGSTQGSATFYVYDESWSHSLLKRPGKQPVTQLDVETVPFEHALISAQRLRRSNQRLIVKIDAEGAEYDILMNTPAAALQNIDELFIEVHHYALGTRSALLSQLAHCGFSLVHPVDSGAQGHQLLQLRRLPSSRPHGAESDQDHHSA